MVKMNKKNSRSFFGLVCGIQLLHRLMFLKVFYIGSVQHTALRIFDPGSLRDTKLEGPGRS